MRQTIRSCCFLFLIGMSSAQQRLSEYGTITEATPSVPQYFSWINNTNEGSTEAQTMINLAFFEWLHDAYGMHLGIYAWDAGNIDSAQYYGSMQTDKFRRQFPGGFQHCAERADSFGCRLGLWAGPDGFGTTPEQETARVDLLVTLCRDYGVQLFKFDSVCGQLRDDKQATFARAMAACREYTPDLIVLNHRLNLGKALPHATTFLWGGAETYIDVHMDNWVGTATHNRLGALSRGLPPKLQRLTEDCGVCLSSCLDYWEDDLVLQAFNRCLILAPEIYGNPWLLRDDEYPKLARLFNLHYRNRDILVKGMRLPEARYGPHAMARGDGNTRFVTLRNLTWAAVTYQVRLDEEIGLTGQGPVQVRRYHPSENMLGTFDYGNTLSVEVAPFRSYLLMATVTPGSDIGVKGCDYEVVRDMGNKPVLLKLLGLPGDRATVKLHSQSRFFGKAFIDGQCKDELLTDGVDTTFPGDSLTRAWHRKLADLTQTQVPGDAEQLYEATCFSAQNNALEVQSLHRSGPTRIPQVQRARTAFFEQTLFWQRGIWDRYMFDERFETFFSVYHYRSDKRINGGALRLDLGDAMALDNIAIHALWPVTRETAPPATLAGEVSTDLINWTPVLWQREDPSSGEITAIKVANIRHNGGEHTLFDTDVKVWTANVRHVSPIRYVRITEAPDRIAEICAWVGNRQVNRAGWRATHLFAPYPTVQAEAAWQATVQIDKDAPHNSYVCVALDGIHGKNKAFAALRVGAHWVGASHRAPSFPCVVWEYGPSTIDRNNTYFFPVTDALRGQQVDVVVLGLKGCQTDIKPHAWITAYPVPYESMALRLE